MEIEREIEILLLNERQTDIQKEEEVQTCIAS